MQKLIVGRSWPRKERKYVVPVVAPKFISIFDLISWLYNQRYVFWGEKPMHPKVIMQWSLTMIMQQLPNFRKAVLNPKYKGK